MKSLRLRRFGIYFLSIYLIGTFLITSHVRADEEEGSKKNTRTAAWYNFKYGTTPLGMIYKLGTFGPDFGFGEQGIDVQFQTLFGGYVSYRSTGLGMGLGGPLLGYGGINSFLGAASYGPYAYGGNPQIQPTPGWSTEGIMSGSFFGPNVNYFTAQPGIMSLLFGMLGGGLYPGYGSLGLGGYGGYGSLGLGGFGYGSFGGWW